MTPERQQQVMAEALGWKKREHCPGYYMEDREGYVYTLPDWGGDLNAMHDAEKLMTSTQAQYYVDQLDRMCMDVTDQDNVFATAAQRAEAFLRALGKWEES